MNIYDIKIGDMITVSDGMKIAKEFGLTYIINRIESQPDMYKDFIFDGCSCVPDELLGLFTGCKWKDITYRCCLQHDIQYAYGDVGNDREKKVVDKIFEKSLIEKAGMKKWIAKIFLIAVKTGGSKEFGLGFSWGFANIKKQ